MSQSIFSEIKNFNLTAKTVVLSVNGPRTLLIKKYLPYKRKVSPEMTFMEVFKNEVKIDLTEANAAEYHVILNRHATGLAGGYKFPLSGKVQDFIQCNYKRPSATSYSIRIAKRKATRRSQCSRNIPPRIIDLEIDSIIEDNNIGVGSNEEEDGTEMGGIKTDQTLGGMNFSAVKDGAVPPPSVQAPVAPQHPTSSRSATNIERVKNEHGVFNSEDSSSMVSDLKAQGISYRNLVPIVARKLQNIGNESLIQAQEEIRRLKKAERHQYSGNLWDKLYEKAPRCCRLLDKLL